MDSLANFLAVGLRRVLATLLAVLVLVAALETGAWAFFEISWPAATEIQGLLLAAFALLAAAYGVHCRFHLGVDALTSRLPATARRLVARLVALGVVVLGGLLAYYGWALVRQVSNTLPATGWPAAVGYLPAVLGGLGIAFFGLVEALRPGPGLDDAPRRDADDAAVEPVDD